MATAKKTAPKSAQTSPPTDSPEMSLGSIGSVKPATVQGGAALKVQQANAGFVQLVNARTPPVFVFDDGYDLQQGFKTVQHLVLADEPDVEDARYGEYLAYMDRVQVLGGRLSQLAARRYANAEAVSIAPRAVGAIAKMGPLVSDDEDGDGDVIEIHTQEALRLFLGFDAGMRADGVSQYSIPGAVRVGTQLRSLSSLVAFHGNPYAEVALMRVEGMFAQLRIEIERLQKKHMILIDESARAGIRLNVRRNRAPQKFPLGFRSPYGYACAALVGQFDYLARVVDTTKKAGLVNSAGAAVLSKEEARLDLLNIKTEFRAVFNAILRMGVFLNKADIAVVNRADWVMYQLTRTGARLGGRERMAVSERVLSEGGDTAKQAKDEAMRLARMRAVQLCENLFGVLPSALLLGDVGPQFVSSRVRVSAEERALIEDIVGKRRAGNEMVLVDK